MENPRIDGYVSHSPRELALWLTIACILVTAIGFSWNPTPFAQALAAIFIACALVHAGFFYGARPTLVLFGICVAITFTMENIGAATGFPFGHYHFEVDSGLPHVGSIPLIVGPLWFGAGYFSWVVASILLDGADRRLAQLLNVIALPIVAAFVMTQWDFGDGSAGIDDCQSLDMARGRRRFWRAAVELSWMASHLMALLSVLRHLSP